MKNDVIDVMKIRDKVEMAHIRKSLKLTNKAWRCIGCGDFTKLVSGSGGFCPDCMKRHSIRSEKK